jgi:hypothetical protein
MAGYYTHKKTSEIQMTSEVRGMFFKARLSAPA